MYVYICVFVYVCIYVSICVYAYRCVYMHACIYVFVYVCGWVYTYIFYWHDYIHKDHKRKLSYISSHYYLFHLMRITQIILMYRGGY